MTGGDIAPTTDAVQSVGRYALVAELGRGGTATIFLAIARDEPGAGPVVLKVLRAYDEDRELRRMFVNESQLALRLKHPNVVRTFDVGRDGKNAFLVMEHLEGRPLSKLLGPTGDVPLPLALLALADALDGLHYAHELCDPQGASYNIVHRDISPHNIFITYEGVVKVLDFGAAKFTDATASTAAGAIKGRLRYMAPEQAAGRAVDRRADIFSMGIVLWQAITGRSLWADVDSATVVSRLLSGDMPSPGLPHGDVTPELLAACRRALAHDPGGRFETAEAFANVLRDELRKHGERASHAALSAYLGTRFAAEKEHAGRVVDERLRQLSSCVTPLVGPARPSSASRRQKPSLALFALAPAALLALLAPFVWARFHRQSDPQPLPLALPPSAAPVATPAAAPEPPAALAPPPPAVAPPAALAPTAAPSASAAPTRPVPAARRKPEPRVERGAQSPAARTPDAPDAPD